MKSCQIEWSEFGAAVPTGENSPQLLEQPSPNNWSNAIFKQQQREEQECFRQPNTQLLSSLFKRTTRLTWVRADFPRSLAGFIFPAWAEVIVSSQSDANSGSIEGSNPNQNSLQVFLGFEKAADARSWVATLKDPFQAEIVKFDPSKDPRWQPNAPQVGDIRPPKAIITLVPKPNTPGTIISATLEEIRGRRARAFYNDSDKTIYILSAEVDAAHFLRDGLRLWVKAPLQNFRVDVQETWTLYTESVSVNVNLLHPNQATGAGRSIHDSFRILNRQMFCDKFELSTTLEIPNAPTLRRTILRFHKLGDAFTYLAAWQGASFDHYPTLSTIENPLRPLKREAEDEPTDPIRKKARISGKNHSEILDLSSNEEIVVTKSRLDTPPPKTKPEVIDIVSSDEESGLIDLSSDEDVVEVVPPPRHPRTPSRKSDSEDADPVIAEPTSLIKKALKMSKRFTRSLKRDPGSTEGCRALGVASDMAPEDLTMGSGPSIPTAPLGPSSKPNSSTLAPAPPARGKKENKQKGTRSGDASAAKATKAKESRAELVDRGPIVDLPISLISLPPLSKPTPEHLEAMRADIPVRMSDWFGDRRCQEPERSTVERTVQLLPDTGEFLLAFEDLKEGRVSSPLAIIQALSSDYNPRRLNIGPDDAAIYIAPTSAVKSRLDTLAEAISGVQGVRRQEIREAIDEIAEELTTAGHPEEYVVRLLYAGTTCLLSNRGNFDQLSLAHKGDDQKKDPRSPHMQAASIGGGATSPSDSAIVYWKDGAPRIRGYRSTIQPDGPGGDIHFPVITHIAVIGIKSTDTDLRRTLESIMIGYCARRHLNVLLGAYPQRLVDSKLVASLQAQIDPETDENLLFLADAPGVHDIPFPLSCTGDLYCSLTETLAQRPAVIYVEDFHDTPGHESNVRTVTKDEINSMVKRLKRRPGQKVIICLGSTVAWVFILRHLCTNPKDKRLENHPFFLPVLTTILWELCILILMPHPGVINYVGDLNWVIDAYCNNISMMLIIGTQSARFKKTFTARGLPLPADAAATILKNCEKIGLYKRIQKELQWPGMRFLWDGPSARAVGRHRDAGCPWEKICWAVAEEIRPHVIWNFSYPPATDEDAERNLICIPAENDKGGGGDVVRSVAVPNLEIPGQFSRDQLHLPKQVRSKNPFFGYFRLDPLSLALQMISPSGESLRTTGDNITTISRGHWAVTKGYTPRALQAHAEKAGFWRSPRDWDKREMAYREKRKKELGKVVKLNLVHTLDEEEIEAAVGRGDSVLFPFQKSYHLELWNESEQDFVKVHDTEPWKFKPFNDERPRGVERVAPFVEKVTGRFGFRLYACSKATDFSPRFIGRTSLVEHVAGNKQTFISKWAGNTVLAQNAKNAR